MKNQFVDMKKILRYMVLLLMLATAVESMAQINKWRDVYTAKKKDTLFGIARKYDITVPDLMEANPEMKQTGYELKKGDTVFIPFAKKSIQPVATPKQTKAVPVTERQIRVGVMLPIHNVDGDGRRMVEYYRGVLMACDSLRSIGISTEVHTWNVPIDANIHQTLLDNAAKECDIIFGPLYTHQVKPLGDFCKANDIKLVIPFSISSDEVTRNPQIFQVYQEEDNLNNDAINAFLARFPKHHPVFIDCNDKTSKKGVFTMGLRAQLEKKGVRYNVTNTASSEEMFAKAFSRTQPNIVVLNTGRSPELNVALAKINGLTTNYPGIVVTLFGYNEWLMYTEQNLNNFFKFDTYIPSTYYYNALSPRTQGFEKNFRRWFKTDLQYAYPRFALTGYDQAMFFLRGLHKYGKNFTGSRSENVYMPMQTPLYFKRIGQGGYQNANFQLIHYTYNHSIESVNY
jgi:murein DD-endopeptidase MepM/ murein hydrolase activator NlpD